MHVEGNMAGDMYQANGRHMSAVGEEMKTKLPGPNFALQQGSFGPTMSDLQFEMENERKQHEDSYRYSHGSHASDNVPLGKPSF